MPTAKQRGGVAATRRVACPTGSYRSCQPSLQANLPPNRGDELLGRDPLELQRLHQLLREVLVLELGHVLGALLHAPRVGSGKVLCELERRE
eukprot:scaffold48791_cov59-Phaeocystis_antarctica.AAC.3